MRDGGGGVRKGQEGRQGWWETAGGDDAHTHTALLPPHTHPQIKNKNRAAPEGRPHQLLALGPRHGEAELSGLRVVVVHVVVGGCVCVVRFAGREMERGGMAWCKCV